MKNGHIHFYSYYTKRWPEGFEGCLCEQDTPWLEVGDTAEYEGKTYTALPTFVGSHLKVQRDRPGAQVAIIGHVEPHGGAFTESESKELVGSGTKTA